MMLYLKAYKDTRKSCEAEVKKKRSLPMKSFEVIANILKKWSLAPWAFFHLFLASAMIASIQPLQAMFFGGIITYVTNGDEYHATVMLIAWGATLLANGVTSFLMDVAQSRLNSASPAVCRERMLKAVVNGGTKFNESFPAGHNVDTFVNQASKLEVILIKSSFALLSSILQMCMGIGFASRISPFASVLFFALIPVMFSIDFVTSRATLKSKESSLLEAELSSQFSNLMECLPVTRACHVGDWAANRMRQPLADVRQGRKIGIFWSSFVQTYFATCGDVYQAFIIIPFGFALVRGAITTGDFAMLMNLTAGMVQPLKNVGGFMRTATNYSGALQRIDDLIEQGTALAEESSANHATDLWSKQEANPLDPLSTEIQAVDVAFHYNQSYQNVLEDIQLKIRKGTYVVNCGPSGCGKSTLLDLLMRFRLPTEGRIQWDGFDINRTPLNSFRGHVSVMFQKTMILTGTIRDNITFGLEEEEPGGVEKAAEMAEIADLIRSLPHGFDTFIGGDDMRLSGGQLQRICLARALYRKPSVLLLDEATSALDTISENAIIKTLVHLRDNEGLTIVSVSHHPSTAIDADEIVVLKDGRISEQGSYKDLVALDGGVFRGLVDSRNE